MEDWNWVVFGIGVFTGVGVGVMTNVFYGLLAHMVVRRRVKANINFDPQGKRYRDALGEQACGTLEVGGWKITRYALMGVSVPVSVRFKFTKRGDPSCPIKLLGKWKADMDTSTSTQVRPGSKREVILATVKRNGAVYPVDLGGTDVSAGSAIKNGFQGDWDLSVEITDADTLDILKVQEALSRAEGKCTSGAEQNCTTERAA